jgi:hypothetical protein
MLGLSTSHQKMIVCKMMGHISRGGGWIIWIGDGLDGGFDWNAK